MPKKQSDYSKIFRHQSIYNILKHCTEDSAHSISDVHERLIKNGVSVSARTIARDISDMSKSHKLVSTETMPARYYVSEGFKPDYQLNFNEEQLQTIVIALESLKQMSPEYLKDLCHKTETTLLGKLPKDVSNEFMKLKALSVARPSLAGESSSKEKENFKLVMKSLREGHVFECQNNSPYKSSEYNKTKRTFAPLLLNMTGGEPYLFVHDEDSKTIKKVKISRLSQISILPQEVDKSLAKMIKNMDKAIGGFGGLDEAVRSYEIVCDKYMSDIFEERKIHHTQVISKRGDSFVINFEANDSFETVRYLAGFGQHIEDVKPAEAYEELKRIWKAGLRAS